MTKILYPAFAKGFLMFRLKIYFVSRNDYYSAVEKIYLTEKAWMEFYLTEKDQAGKGSFPARKSAKWMVILNMTTKVGHRWGIAIESIRLVGQKR
jgi:hypothetical protein